MSETPRHRFYRFGPNVLDCLRGVLWQNGTQVTLTPRVLDILSTLVEHHGELVTKDDFMQFVWGGTAVEDNNLARQISTLRKLLHERPGQREYIATVTGIGYRFVGAVTVYDDLPDDLLPLIGQSSAHPSIAPEEPRLRPARSWLNRSLAAGLASATIIALLLVAWPDDKTEARPPRRSLWPFGYGPGSQSDAAWSPDGSWLALTSDDAGNADIWVHGVGDAHSIRITSSPAHDWQPAWSPDGRKLVFRSERDGGGLYIAAATGGSERRLTTFGSRPQWSPRGDLILFRQATTGSLGAVKLFVADPALGTTVRVTHPALAGLDLAGAAWAPDGRLSIWGRTEAGERQFVTFPLEGGPVVRSAMPEEMTTDTERPLLSSFAWAPSWRFLYFEGQTQGVRNVWRVAVDPETLAWTSMPERLTVGPGSDAGLSISPDGSKLAFSVGHRRPGIWAFDFDPSTGRIAAKGERVVSGESGERGGDASRDGSRIAYRFDRADRQEIWERQGEHPPRLLVSEAGRTQTHPRWSPDAARLAYQRSLRSPTVTRAVAVLDVNTDGGSRESLVELSGSEELIPTDWAADGRTLLAACREQRSAPVGTCVMRLSPVAETSAVTRLASDPDHNLYQQRYSPNQRWISFVAMPRRTWGVTRVHVMPADGGPWRAMTDGASYDDKARWSPDGRVLYYISNRDGRFEVWGRRFDAAAGQPEGDPFRVTSLEGARQRLSPSLPDMEMFITPTRIFLPMYEVSSRVWVLDQVDR